MSTSEGIEKTRVRKEITNYFSSKGGYDFQKFGKYEKINLGGKTGMYIVETVIGDAINYALVPVNRAYVQGIIILSSTQVSMIIKRFIDGLQQDFGN